jgi:Flp pilus assembly protein TadD
MDDKFESAEALYKAGQMMEAQAAFWALARLNPRQPRVWARLGDIALSFKQFSQAFDFFGNAYDFDPDNPDIRLGLGRCLLALGKAGDALPHLKLAARQRPKAHLELANAFEQLGDIDSATQALENHLARFENDAEVMIRLSDLLMRLKRYDEADQHLHFAVLLEEANPTPLVMRGNIKLALGERSAARTYYLRALDVNPTHAPALFNLGNLAMADGQFEDAAVLFASAHAQAPNDARLANNLAIAQKELGRLNEAEATLRAALVLDPDFADLHWNLATVRFLLGDWKEGFEQAEWRWDMASFTTPKRDFACPPWDGKPLPQGTLLVHAEQGLGDAIQFARYLPLLADKVRHLAFEVDPTQTDLFARSFPNVTVIARGQPLPKADAHLALMSAPRFLGGPYAPVTPYLKADPKLVATWKERLTALGQGPWVGLCWQGNPGHQADRRRSPGLAALLPLLDIQGIRLASLQHGMGREQLLKLTDGPLDLGNEDDPAIGNDFATTAAIVEALDLVIAPDTAIAHLAGALGKPVWLLLPFVPDWRWQMAGEVTPWYPSARLFRQPTPADWATPVGAIALGLKELHV